MITPGFFEFSKKRRWILYLSPASADAIDKWRHSNVLNGARVVDILPFLQSELEGLFIHSDDGITIGYCLKTAIVEEHKYSNTLAEFDFVKEKWEELFYFLPNLMRSLQLERFLLRSDNGHALRFMAHHASQYFHLLQFYQAPTFYSLARSDLELTRLDEIEAQKSLTQYNMLELGVECFNENNVTDVYHVTSDKKNIGIVVQSSAMGLDGALIYPVVRTSQRRKKWGTSIVMALAEKLRAEGIRPLIVIKPEDAIRYRFVKNMKAFPVSDILTVKPNFHLSTSIQNREE